jgi:GTPase
MLKYPPEDEYGNIEYKLKLVGKSDERIAGISTQMRMRVDEGSGEAIYVIGVTDNGEIRGVDDDEFTESFNNLSIAAGKNDYSITMMASKDIKSKDTVQRKVYELLIRERNEQSYIDIKVAVAGSVDAGKSSMLGVLTSGHNDDGRGSARMSIFNFKHEVSSGRTSSIAHHILGFDDKGHVMNYTGMHKKGWPEIIKDSSKVISFYDLCGHEKYLKTTIRGLTSSCPDMCLILVGANMGLTRITHEHIFLCVTLKIPFAIVLTKIDICKNRKNVMKETTASINKLLKLPGLRRIPYKVNGIEDVIICAKNVQTESVVPIFNVSNVTGVGIKFVKQFLNLIGKVKSNIKDEVKVVEMHIDTTFYVPGVGTVIGGQLISGTVSVGDKLSLGPNGGEYKEVTIRSIHCKRVPMQTVKYGSYVCLGLKKIDRKSIRRGNVLVTRGEEISVKEFDADITVLKAHSTTIKHGYEPVIYTCTVRQSAKLILITKKVNARYGDDTNDYILRTGDKATARFRFSYHPEYIKAGSRLLMCEGKCKIIGVVK